MVKRASKKSHKHHISHKTNHNSELLMTFNKVMLIVVLGLVVVSGITYTQFVINNDEVYNSPKEVRQNSCYDNDGGRDYDRQGKASGIFEGKAYTHTDYCLIEDNQLAEYYCVNGVAIKTVYPCANGQFCSQGSCIYPN